MLVGTEKVDSINSPEGKTKKIKTVKTVIDR